MNLQSIKLLNILSACQPENESLAKISSINAIKSMEAYQELTRRKAFRDEFKEFLTEEKLQSLTGSQLKQLQEALPAIPDCLDNIIYSLKNGDGPKLTAADRPDFMSRASVEGLSERLEDSTGKNYTNIRPEEFMTIFADSTVKSIRDIFVQLPAHCKDYEAVLHDLFGNQKYCISEKEIKDLDAEFAGMVDQKERLIGTGKVLRFKHRLVKGIIGLFFILLPGLINDFVGCFDSTMSNAAFVLMIIAAIVYWKKG